MHRHIATMAFAAVILSGSGIQQVRADAAVVSMRVAPGQSSHDALAQARWAKTIEGWRLAASHGGPGVLAGAGTQTPKISSGNVVSTTLVVGQAASIPTVRFAYTTGSAGLVGVSFDFKSPNGNVDIYVNYQTQGYTRRGTVVVSNPTNAPFFAQPGAWTLNAAVLADYAGNYTQYTAAQLARVFQPNYINVVNNGPIDITPPVITSGRVVTPTVSLSSPLPEFELQLTGNDNLSGIYYSLAYITPPNGQFAYISIIPEAFPIKSGVATAYTLLPNNGPLGTWTITAYEACDVAGNCLYDNTAADVQKLFGTTTFKVVK